MKPETLSRRRFLSLSTAASSAVLLAACQPKVVEVEKVVTQVVQEVVKETVVVAETPQVVEKVVEKVITNTPAPKERVVVKFMVPGSPQEDSDFAPVFEEFAKRWPDIDAQYSPAGTGYTPQYQDKVMTMMAGGVLPDVFKSLDTFFGALAELEAFVPLDDYVAAYPEITVFDDFFEAHVEGCRYKGKLQALPNDGAPQGMWYNVDLWKEAGHDLPGWETDWNDLLLAAKDITREEGAIITHYGLGRPPYLPLVWSNGGDRLNEDGTKCLLDQPAAVEAFRWMQDLVITHKVTPGPEALAEMDQNERFQTGRLGAFFGVRGSLGALRSIQDFYFDAAPMPLSPKSQRLTTLAIGYTSIWRGSKHYDEAYTLAAWICSPEGQRLRISRGYAHPSRKSCIQEDWFKRYTCDRCASYGVNEIFPEMLLRGESKPIPPHPKSAEIDQTITTHLDYLWDGSKPAEQFAADVTAAVDDVLQS